MTVKACGMQACRRETVLPKPTIATLMCTFLRKWGLIRLPIDKNEGNYTLVTFHP